MYNTRTKYKMDKYSNRNYKKFLKYYISIMNKRKSDIIKRNCKSRFNDLFSP